MSKTAKPKSVKITSEPAKAEAPLTAVRNSTSSMFDKLKKSFVPTVKSTVIRVSSEDKSDSAVPVKSTGSAVEQAPKQKIQPIKVQSEPVEPVIAKPSEKKLFSISED